MATVLLTPAVVVAATLPTVSGFGCTAQTGFMVLCRWDSAGADARYEISWRRADGTGATRSTEETSIRFGPGGSGTYEYRARAVNGQGEGRYTSWVSVQTKPPLSSSSSAVADAVQVGYGSADAQKYWAVLPEATRGKRPAVVVLHGGYWVGGNATGNSYQVNQRLYEGGIPSFAVDYRLAQDAPWPAQRDDALDALADIKGKAVKFGIDPDRICVVGASAGGHIALAVASFGSGAAHVACAVAYSPPVDMQLIRTERPVVTGTPTAVQERQIKLADAVETLLAQENPDSCGSRCRSATPPYTATEDDAPALIFAGQNEWLNPEHARRYAAGYRQVPGVEVVVQELPGDTRHSLDYVDEWDGVWAQTLAWFNEQT
jgi:acetyl esterase/lipase